MRREILTIRGRKRPSLARLPGLTAGDIGMRDEDSQLVALLLDARPGERVADSCAGTAGKSLAIAAQMRNKDCLVARDDNDARPGCAGLHSVETRVLASETDRWVKRSKGGFDRVLVDAPCGGTGAWRRNPDARCRAPDWGLRALVERQGRMPASAARLVNPGGWRVHATCSLLIEETDRRVAAFLSTHPESRLAPLSRAEPRLADLGDHPSLTPARHGTDGFLAAVLEPGPPCPDLGLREVHAPGGELPTRMVTTGRAVTGAGHCGRNRLIFGTGCSWRRPIRTGRP